MGIKSKTIFIISLYLLCAFVLHWSKLQFQTWLIMYIFSVTSRWICRTNTNIYLASNSLNTIKEIEKIWESVSTAKCFDAVSLHVKLEIFL